MTFTNLWADLPPEVQDNFAKQAVKIDLKRGDRIYQQGDPPKGIYFVASGLVGLVKLSNVGKEHLLRLFSQGHFFGHRSLFLEEDYHATSIALVPTSLQLVKKDLVWETLNRHPKLLLSAVKVLARELRRCEEQHVLILDHQINIRVAQSLVYLKDLHPEHNWTRQEIANFCASTVSTVIKSLAELEEMGLIRQSGRSIEILDRAQLISLQE